MSRNERVQVIDAEADASPSNTHKGKAPLASEKAHIAQRNMQVLGCRASIKKGYLFEKLTSLR